MFSVTNVVILFYIANIILLFFQKKDFEMNVETYHQ